MTNVQESLGAAMQIEGAIGVALVDWSKGIALGTAGGNSDFDINLAVSGNIQVMRAKMAIIKNLALKGGIEDMLITLDYQYHLIRPSKKNPKLFLYLALNREQANLAMARFKLATIEQELEV